MLLTNAVRFRTAGPRPLDQCNRAGNSQDLRCALAPPLTLTALEAALHLVQELPKVLKGGGSVPGQGDRTRGKYVVILRFTKPHQPAESIYDLRLHFEGAKIKFVIF